VILVGHSLGGSVLLKYLSEEKIQLVAGLFLIAAPYWGAKHWQASEYRLQEDFTSNLLKELPISFYYSRDDDVVPLRAPRTLQRKTNTRKVLRV
jgi:uncharacterized protein